MYSFDVTSLVGVESLNAGLSVADPFFFQLIRIPQCCGSFSFSNWSGFDFSIRPDSKSTNNFCPQTFSHYCKFKNKYFWHISSKSSESFFVNIYFYYYSTICSLYCKLGSAPAESFLTRSATLSRTLLWSYLTFGYLNNIWFFPK